MATQQLKVESSFAKVNYNGQLTCILCSVPVKSAKLWTAHANSKQHIEKLLALKQQKEAALKRKIEINKIDSDGAKRVKVFDVEDPRQHKPVLPPGFFDSNSCTDASNTSSGAQEIKTQVNETAGIRDKQSLAPESVLTGKDEEQSTKPNQLPEGFFDDRKQDARARHVDLKNPLDAEWTKFQKVLQEENQVSDAIVDRDDETSALERDIEEIDQQIAHWNQLNQLEIKKDAILDSVRLGLLAQTVSSEQVEEVGDSDVDDDDFDWRSKGLR